MCDLDKMKGEETVQIIRHKGGRAQFSVVDVSKENEVKEWIEQVAVSAGGIDVLVNNAATFIFGTIDEVTSEMWDKILAVNVKGYAFCAKYVVPHMKTRGSGSIVNIASISSLVAQPAFVPYNTAKGAVLQMTRCMAMDLGSFGIRVNAVCPGTIDTPATELHARRLGKTKEELTQEMCRSHFIKRLGTVRDVSNAVVFLASEESSFITGIPLIVDGGFTAQ